MTEELTNEIENVMIENEIDNEMNNETFMYSSSNCSTPIPSIQIPLILYTPANNIFAKYINSYTPDLFRKCWFVPNINIPDICPNININSKTISYIQDILPENIIKAFLYHGFSSNINDEFFDLRKFKPNTFDYQEYIVYLNEIKKELFTENYGNFNGFGYFFTKRYPGYTLLNQISYFIFSINKFHNYSLNGKFPCNYTMPWEASILCENKIYTLNQLNFTFNIALMNNIYQLYNVWSGKNSSNQTINQKFDVFFNYRNFFQVLLYTQEVLRDVHLEYTYLTTQKEYCRKEYMNRQYFLKCVELFKQYKENKIRLS